MSFLRLLEAAQRGVVDAVAELYALYRPMIVKMSKLWGRFCEDLFQELSLYFLQLITEFVIRC